jgi:hypothetical protein
MKVYTVLKVKEKDFASYGCHITHPFGIFDNKDKAFACASDMLRVFSALGRNLEGSEVEIYESELNNAGLKELDIYGMKEDGEWVVEEVKE